jgi:hypothetical protein
MKKVMIILIMLISVKVSAPPAGLMIPAGQSINPYLDAWQATGAVESSNNRFAVNYKDPNGGSYGIVQIGQLKLDEYNAANGTNYQLADCFDIEVSRKIFMWHYMKYGIDIETASKAWNGSGPATEEYWRKISAELIVQNKKTIH